MHDLWVDIRLHGPSVLMCLSTLEYPLCTNEGETDCGSAAWSFSLFIAWNLLSMVSSVYYLTCLSAQSFLLVHLCQLVYRSVSPAKRFL